MNQFVYALFIELNNQISKMLANLAVHKADGRKVTEFREKAIEKLEILQNDVQRVIDSGELEVEEWIRNNLLRYKPCLLYTSPSPRDS